MTAVELASENHDIFVHVRIIIGMILGISVARLVSGVTRFIQDPGRDRIYPAHLGWFLFLFLSIIHFWWFEFALTRIERWTFPVYFMLICYAVLFVMLATLLLPDQVTEVSGKRIHEDSFRHRRRLFYILLLGLFLVDVLDTLAKGPDYYRHVYGWTYPVRQSFLIGGTIGALFAKSARYDTAFVGAALIVQIAWIVDLFDVLY